MFIRADLKQAAKEQLRGKWGNAVLVVFIYAVISLIFSGVSYQLQLNESLEAAPFSLLSLFVLPPLMIGVIMYFFTIVKGSQLPEVSTMFRGYSLYWKSVGLQLWTALWIFLWTLLFFIPGIIKAFAYSQATFILAENNNVKVREALKTSIKMTQGYKWRIFVLGLSFIGWAFLCFLTAGIGFLWLGPYTLTTYCNLYYKLKETSIEKGVCSRAEFGE